MSRFARHCVLLCVVGLWLAACTPPSIPSQSASPTAAPTVESSTPTPEPVALDATLRVDQEGFSLDYPRNWHAGELSGTLAIAPSREALESATASEDLVVLIDATPLNDIAGQYGESVVADVQSFFRFVSEGPQEAGYTLSATTPITVDGQPGIEADLTAEGGAGRLVALLAPPQAVRVLGQASPGAWEEQRPVFEGIVASLEFFPPVAPPTPTAGDQATQPVLTREGPQGFEVRIGGNTGPGSGRFVLTRGLAVGEDGKLYVAESSRGVWVFEPDGTLVTTFGKEDLLDAYDVAHGPHGEVFVADYGRNAIARFGPDGTLEQIWGEIGDAPEQFGLSSPQRIAVGADGSVYALDSRVSDETGSTVSSIIRFAGEDGSFIERIDLPAGSSPNDFAVDAEGNIYLAEPFGGAVVKLDGQGQVVARLGENISPEGITAGALDLDAQGNIYVAAWGRGVLKLSPDGTLVAEGGAIAPEDTTPEPGQFVLPNGLAVGPRGLVWVSDNSGEYSAVTALRLVTDQEAQATADAIATAGATPIPGADLLRQWAVAAEASSSYDENYSAENATGPPDVEGCRDSTNAWASADPNGLDTLELTYDTPVFATQINVHQNHQPGFITQVEVRDERGNYTSVYRTAPKLQDECPYVLSIRFARTPSRIVGVRLTIDQRSGADWNEIDAVELVGLP